MGSEGEAADLMDATTGNNARPGHLDFAETVVARLCHDLSGLSGTLLNMLEMAEDEGGGEALAVSMTAGRALVGRLRLLRAAWGGTGASRDAAAIADLLTNAAGFPKTRTDWSGCAPGAFAPPLARFLLNVALTGTECLPRGGTVRVSGNPNGALTVVLEGLNAAWPPAWDQLAGIPATAVPANLPARELLPVLTLLLAAADGITLRRDGPVTLLIQA